MLSFAARMPFVRRVIDFEISIAAHRDRTLFRKQSKQLCRPSARGIDKAMDVESSSFDTYVYRRFTRSSIAGMPFGDLRKRVLAEQLCSSSKGQWSVPTVSMSPTDKAFRKTF
jgi:hypothetical protein